MGTIINKWTASAEADIKGNTVWLATPGTNQWQAKAGCPDTITRTFNSGKYSGIGPRVYAEVTAADLDLADARAVVLWDRDKTRAEQAADAAAKRLEQLLKLTNA